MRTELFMYFCIKSCIGTQGVKFATCKSVFKPPVVYSADRTKAVVPELVLLFVALWFILRGDVICLSLCYFVLVFFSHFSIATTSLGEES